MSTSWCKKCKAKFDGEKCPGGHANFMYTKKIPGEESSGGGGGGAAAASPGRGRSLTAGVPWASALGDDVGNKTTPTKGIERIAANDPTLTSCNMGESAVFQMKAIVTMEKLSEALKTNTHLLHLDVSKCGINDACAKMMGEALAVNTTLVNLRMSKNKISNEGCIDLARGMRNNRSLRQLDILGCGTKYAGECLDEWGMTFDVNCTFFKIIWGPQLSPQLHKITKGLTRNMNIDKRLSEGESIDKLGVSLLTALPDALRALPPTNVRIVIEQLGMGSAAAAGAGSAPAPSSPAPASPKPKAASPAKAKAAVVTGASGGVAAKIAAQKEAPSSGGGLSVKERIAANKAAAAAEKESQRPGGGGASRASVYGAGSGTKGGVMARLAANRAAVAAEEAEQAGDGGGDDSSAADEEAAAKKAAYAEKIKALAAEKKKTAEAAEAEGARAKSDAEVAAKVAAKVEAEVAAEKAAAADAAAAAKKEAVAEKAEAEKTANELDALAAEEEEKAAAPKKAAPGKLKKGSSSKISGLAGKLGAGFNPMMMGGPGGSPGGPMQLPAMGGGGPPKPRTISDADGSVESPKIETHHTTGRPTPKRRAPTRSRRKLVATTTEGTGDSMRIDAAPDDGGFSVGDNVTTTGMKSQPDGTAGEISGAFDGSEGRWGVTIGGKVVGIKTANLAAAAAAVADADDIDEDDIDDEEIPVPEPESEPEPAAKLSNSVVDDTQASKKGLFDDSDEDDEEEKAAATKAFLEEEAPVEQEIHQPKKSLFDDSDEEEGDGSPSKLKPDAKVESDEEEAPKAKSPAKTGSLFASDDEDEAEEEAKPAGKKPSLFEESDEEDDAPKKVGGSLFED